MWNRPSPPSIKLVQLSYKIKCWTHINMVDLFSLIATSSEKINSEKERPIQLLINQSKIISWSRSMHYAMMETFNLTLLPLEPPYSMQTLNLVSISNSEDVKVTSSFYSRSWSYSISRLIPRNIVIKSMKLTINKYPNTYLCTAHISEPVLQSSLQSQ